jgi:hypothetical protein
MRAHVLASSVLGGTYILVPRKPNARYWIKETDLYVSPVLFARSLRGEEHVPTQNRCRLLCRAVTSLCVIELLDSPRVLTTRSVNLSFQMRSIAYRTLSLDTHQLLLPHNLLSQYLILLLIGFSLMKFHQ